MSLTESVRSAGFFVFFWVIQEVRSARVVPAAHRTKAGLVFSIMIAAEK
jgi:hypothetical protein